MRRYLHSFLKDFYFGIVSEKEIKELEQSYCQLYTWNNINNRQQQITSQIFSNILSMVFPSVLIPGVFEAFDENRDGKFGKEIYQ